MERLKVGELLPDGREQDRLAGDGHDRKGGTTAGVTIELGQHHAVDADGLVERLRGDDRVLTDHGIDHEQGLVRRDRVTHLTQLIHQLCVDRETTRCVDDDDVIELGLGELHAAARHRDGVAYAVARLGCVDCDTGAFGANRKLVDGVGSLQVGRHQQGLVPAVLEVQRELARQRRLTCTLESGEQDDRGRVLRQA